MFDSIIILGPTSSGKTSLSIKLAQLLKTEIINADSMYIYKDLSIGTAKPSIDEMNGIKHHLIGFLDTESKYNVSQYRHDATGCLNEMFKNKMIPIIVGGTGFYIDSLINSYSYGETIVNESVRQQLNQMLETFGKEYMYKYLKSIDPETAHNLHANDTVRVLRAIEIYKLSGQKKSDIKNNEKPILSNPLIIGLDMPRSLLYDRINKRVDIMINSGLINEVKNLYEKGYNPSNCQSMKGIGYKELVDYFEGKIDLTTAIDLIKQHSRNYAKRQLTWFKRNSNICWFNPLEEKNLANKIIEIFEK